MSAKKTERRINEEESVALKYNGAFPLHDAVEANDLRAIDLLVKRKDIGSYNETGKLPLHIASRKGHAEVVRTLLTLEADVNSVDRTTGRTPLHYASLFGHSTVVDILLKHGAVVYDQDKNGAYPLHLAAEGGHCSVVGQLISVGALPDCKDKDNADPMHYAAKHDKVAALEALVAHRAKLEAKDKDGATAMHYAAVHEKCSALRKLSCLGASVNSICKLGETPLHHACRAVKINSIVTLSELQADLHARNNENECAIHVASKFGYWQSVKQLLKSGTDKAITHTKQKQSIHIAAEHGCCDVIKVLKNGKADLNAKDKDGNRPLHYAAVADQLQAIQKLIEFGADINAPRKKGLTVIHMAAKDRKVKVVDLLGRLGADCNIENKAGLFPLYYAALNDDLITAKYLIRYGAEVNKLNKDGEGMLHIMVEEEKLQGITTMMELKANCYLQNQDGETCVHLASKEKQSEVLKHLNRIGVDLNAKNKEGISALHVATMNGDGGQVDLLNDLGANLNFQSKDFRRKHVTFKICNTEWPPSDVEKEDYWKIKVGMTPIHLSLLYGHQDVFKHLITCGADVNLGNDSGETVFHLAVLYDMVEWLQTLITMGADRNCKDKLGRTPLHYAAHTGSLRSIRFLLKYGAVITETDNEGRQPLHYAAQEGHYLLLPEITGQNRAVEINCKDNNGRTPLHFACEKGMIDTIVELVQLKADVHATDENGNTAVHIAAARGCHETIVQLGSLCCNMDKQNKDLKTPLHLAGDTGQGEAMEYLLMCGCNPNIKDKHDLFPSTYKLQGLIKQSVTRRIKEFHANKSSRHKTGEVCHEGRMVSSGKAAEFEKLGITVTLQSCTPVSPIIFFHRTPADAEHLAISLNGLEEILSDVYEVRVLHLDRACTLIVEVPMDGYPGKFESCLRTTDGTEYKEFTTSEENGVPVFVGKLPIAKDTVHKFAVVVRPRIFQYNIGTDGGTVISEVDRRIRIEVPSQAFHDDININMQVLRTDDIEQKTGRLFATDVVNVTTHGAQPDKKVQVQLPLHSETDDPEDMLVFSVDNELDINDETKWNVVQSYWRIQNQCVTFSISHFSLYVAISVSEIGRLTIEAKKRLVKEKIKRALQRETSVLFFYAICPKKDTFLTIFECTTPGRFKRRSEFWENEGFQFHPQIRHSGHFVAKPNQQFYFLISGNLQFVGENSKRLLLTFNPRSHKYQSFYLRRLNKKEPLIGEIQVLTTLETKEEDDKMEDTLVTNIPMEVPVNSKCLLS